MLSISVWYYCCQSAVETKSCSTVFCLPACKIATVCFAFCLLASDRPVRGIKVLSHPSPPVFGFTEQKTAKNSAFMAVAAHQPNNTLHLSAEGPHFNPSFIIIY